MLVFELFVVAVLPLLVLQCCNAAIEGSLSTLCSIYVELSCAHTRKMGGSLSLSPAQRATKKELVQKHDRKTEPGELPIEPGLGARSQLRGRRCLEKLISRLPCRAHVHEMRNAPREERMRVVVGLCGPTTKHRGTNQKERPPNKTYE